MNQLLVQHQCRTKNNRQQEWITLNLTKWSLEFIIHVDIDNNRKTLSTHQTWFHLKMEFFHSFFLCRHVSKLLIYLQVELHHLQALLHILNATWCKWNLHNNHYDHNYYKTKLLNIRGSTCTYLFAVLPVTDDIKSLKVKNIPLSPTNLVAASVLGYW